MNRPPLLRLHHDELIVDSFAGAGGASLGIRLAFGREPDIAINHDREAIAMHQANHPGTRHLCEDVWQVDPREACAGRPVGLLWASPDCKHFSKAKGGKPVEKKIRMLAWVVTRWARAVRPRVIILENVEEFADWGPLMDDGRPDPARKSLTFRRWKAQLENLGYKVEERELRACDYGAPTTRKRLFVVARCDGLPIAWPQPTHAEDGAGGLQPWRTAAECIDWSLPTYSIFLTKREAKRHGVKRPLARNTMRRIARGMFKFVIDAADPFIVPYYGLKANETRAHSVDKPLRTQTGDPTFSLVAPLVAKFRGDSSGTSIATPLPTVTAGPRENPAGAAHALGLVGATLIQTGYGERPGQLPRVPGLGKPIGTLVGTTKHGLVSAFLAKNYEGFKQGAGIGLAAPAHTITGKDHHSLVVGMLNHQYSSNTNGGQGDPRLPAKCITTGGHHALVHAFLMKFYGEGSQWSSPADPMHTLPAKDRMAIVTVHGEPYVIADIGMRMLQPRELFRAQGFDDSYVIDVALDGKRFTKDTQVRMVGNSVCPPIAAAMVRAQFEEQVDEAAA